MTLHTLNELHNKTLESIRKLISAGYRIDPNSHSDNDHVFIASLTDGRTGLVIKTVQDDHKRTFTCQFIPAGELHMSYEEISNLKTVYYHSYNDIYADSKEEATNARNKFYANALGVDNTNNPIQAFADMLGNHLSKYFKGN